LTVLEGAPTSSDDPRLQGWYHTIELGDGIVTAGYLDLRSIVDGQGLPESLEGKTALDVGTAEGFWAFELERRGAERVVGIDIARWVDFDWLPEIKEAKRDVPYEPARRFELARGMRGSQVEHKVCSVYELSPETVGTFDVTFCGSLLLHLQSPIQAMLNIRSVTREMAIVTTLGEPQMEELAPDRPWIGFGQMNEETGRGLQLGSGCVYWSFSTRGLQDIMRYCGFAWTEPLEPFSLPPAGIPCVGAIGYTRPPD
jgi:SAM-dependent methyltransferase